MKIKLLMSGLFGLISVACFAQKSELNNAQSKYDVFDQTKGNNVLQPSGLALNSLKDARTSIDKAASNEKTANLPQTYALKGSIYIALALTDTAIATSTPLYTAADEALKKAKETDTKGEYKKLIDNGYLYLGYYLRNRGAKEYNSKQIANAYKSFDAYRELMPEDTEAVYLAGATAAATSNWDAAIKNYNKLLTLNYSKKAQVYQDLSGFYLAKNDTANAIKTMTEGSAKFPNDAEMSRRVVEMNLQTGHQDEVLSKIQSAIANDPKNKSLYYYAGLTYSQVADGASKKAAKLKDAAAKAPLMQTKDENLSKAADMYKKALEIDPNYFEANLNMGYVMTVPAIDLYNAARQLPMSKQKEYAADMAKANTLLETAKPYLQKAVDLNPKSIDALNNLKNYYIIKNDMPNVNKIKQQIDQLNGGSSTPAQK